MDNKKFVYQYLIISGALLGICLVITNILIDQGVISLHFMEYSEKKSLPNYEENINPSSYLKHIEGEEDHSEEFAKKFPKDFIIKISTNQKKIALTFDDGPDTLNTIKVLDILNSYRAKASFFMVGFKMERHPQVVKRIEQMGHAIGNHSYSHPNFLEQGDTLILEKQIVGTDHIFEKILHTKPVYFRPPYGKINSEQIRWVLGKGYKIVHWSINTFDWDIDQIESEDIFQAIKDQIEPGAIILLHVGETRYKTVEALPKILEWLQQNGYQCVTLDELLKVIN
jgi:peptidoglycan-N-acetylglucosamine deacetylase